MTEVRRRDPPKTLRENESHWSPMGLAPRGALALRGTQRNGVDSLGTGWGSSPVTGSLENPAMAQYITDVLEGTRWAFDKRGEKYDVSASSRT